MTAARQAPPGFAAIGIFLCFGAAMAALAALTLLWRNTSLERLWTLNPIAWKQLAPLGAKAGIPFLLLSAALVTASIGWFHRRRWGWFLAVLIIAAQIAGDIINLVRGDRLRGTVGAVIAGALLMYLLTPRVHRTFHRSCSLPDI